MPNIGLGLSLSNGVSLKGISSEARSWNTRAGSPLTPTQLALYDTFFFRPMISAGLFAKFDRLNIYALNGVGNEALALQNTISSSFTVSKISTPTFSVNGFAATAVSTYLDLNYNPSTQASRLSLNSITQFVVVKNPSFSAAARSMSARTGTPASRMSVLRDVGAPQQLTINSTNTTGAAANVNVVTTGNVFLGGVRSSSSSSVAYVNKNAGSVSATASTSLPNTNVYELVENFANPTPSPTTPFDAFSHMASGHGQALTQAEIESLQDILNGLWTALGL